MNDLILVQEILIGAENVNSVNSRDLYNDLGLSKGQYSRWVQSNLIELFTENEDYIGVRQDVEGNYVLSYIVTLDVAKHLCMMAKTPKAMKFRKYFIEVEKQSLKVLTIPEQIVLLAQGHQEIDSRINVLEHQVNNDIPLSPAQKHNIKKKVTDVVYSLKNNHNLNDDFIPKCYSRVWKKVKNHFIVSSYMEVPKSKFDELVGVVDSVTINDVV